MGWYLVNLKILTTPDLSEEGEKKTDAQERTEEKLRIRVTKDLNDEVV